MDKYQVRDFIQNNKNLFKVGNTFSEDVITKAFGIKTPKKRKAHTDNVAAYGAYACAKLGAQTKINKILAERGLYMKQTAYTTYEILGKKGKVDTVTAQVASMKKSAQTLNTRASRLAAGIQRAATASKAGNTTWSKVKNPELVAIEANYYKI